MIAEVVAIGDEITSGRLLDTNSQWLSQRLEELGVRVLYHVTVGDELEPCAAVIRQAMDRADVVVATGGLGPTADDLTRQAIAAAAGRELVLDATALEHVRGLFARRRRAMPEQNEVQALFPAGSRVIPNPHGTAPGIDLELPRTGRPASRIFALPGVPAEMQDMWHGYVSGALGQAGAGRRVIVRRNIKCFGAGESQIESMLPDLIRRGRTPTVGINASGATIILRVAAEGSSEEECRGLIEPIVGVIRQSLGNLVFGEGDDELQDVVLRLLAARGRSLATVEVGTAGLVAQWLGSAVGPIGNPSQPVAQASSLVPEQARTLALRDRPYRGGLVARDGAALVALLGVPADTLAHHPLASSEAAEAMAAACRARFAADYGLAVGGFPDTPPDMENPEPVFLALASSSGVAVKQVPYAFHPAMVTAFCAESALNILRLALL